MTIESMQSYMNLVNEAAGLGVDLTEIAEVGDAQAALTRAFEIFADARRIQDLNTGDLVGRAAASYLAGDIDADGVALLGVQAELGDSRTAQEVFAHAIELATSPAMKALRKIGDRWTLALRPAAERAVIGFDQLAATLPATPFDEEQIDPNLRRNLDMALSKWDAVYDLAVGLGGGPTNRHSPSTSVHRWLHPELASDPDGREFVAKSLAIAAHRAGACAGVWTTDEIRLAQPPPVDPLTDPTPTGQRSRKKAAIW